jgi:hypothetical protein
VAKIPGPAVHGTHYHDSPDEYLQILASGMNRDGTPFAHNVVDGGGLVPKGYQQIAANGSARSLTVPAGATLAIIRSEAQGWRYRSDGVDPTTSVGMPLWAAEGLSPFNANLSALRFREMASGAILNVDYYGSPV